MKKIILISGWARSGKDTTAEIINSKLKSSEIISLATPMKKMLSDTFGITEGKLNKYKNDAKNCNVEIVQFANEAGRGYKTVLKRTDFRQLLQNFGTEMKKYLCEHVWTNLAISTIRASDKDIMLISDWRLKAELWKLQETFEGQVITIRVIREGQINTSVHISEVDLDEGVDFDYIIKNNGVDLEELSATIDKIIEREET